MSDWRDDSACRTRDPGTYFAERGRLSPNSTEACTTCPVRDQCLQFAIDSPWEPYGVWGGKQAKEIRPMWRQRHPMHAMEVSELLGSRRDRS